MINESAETTQFRVVQDTSCKDKKYTSISVKVQLNAKFLNFEHLTCKSIILSLACMYVSKQVCYKDNGQGLLNDIDVFTTCETCSAN